MAFRYSQRIVFVKDSKNVFIDGSKLYHLAQLEGAQPVISGETLGLTVWMEGRTCLCGAEDHTEDNGQDDFICSIQSLQKLHT